MVDTQTQTSAPPVRFGMLFCAGGVLFSYSTFLVGFCSRRVSQSSRRQLLLCSAIYVWCFSLITLVFLVLVLFIVAFGSLHPWLCFALVSFVFLVF